MVLTILDRDGQVLLSQNAMPDAAVSPSLEIAVKQQSGNSKISLSAYTLPDTLLWIGAIQLSERYTIFTESPVPILQVTLLFSSPLSSVNQQLLQKLTVHLQSGTRASLDRQEQMTHIILLQFTRLPFADITEEHGVRLLQAWLDVASAVPRHEALTVGSENPLYSLCRQLISPEYSRALLYSYRYLKVQEIVLALCDLLSSGTTNTIVKEREQKGLQKVVQAIRSDPGKSHAIDDLAKMAGLNRSSLQGLFKSYYGTTLRSFVLSCRMEAAYRLITDTDLLLKEIAYRLGYSDPDNFYAAFKQFYGKRAGDLRRDSNNRDEIK